MAQFALRSGLGTHELLRTGVLRVTSTKGQPLTVHPHAVVSLVRCGQARVWCGTSYAISCGDVLLIPEGAPHVMEDARDLELHGLAVCTSCLQSGSGLELMRLIGRVGQGTCAVRRLGEEDARRVDWMLDALGQEVGSRRPGWEAALESLFALLTLSLARAGLPEDTATPGTAWVGQALTFIALHATEQLTLADVARHVQRAPAHVSATVRAQTGRTVGDWIADARLAAARQWILHSDASIEQLAAAVGYPSTSQFYRVFRRVHGMTPGDWRRLHGREF